MDKQEAAKRIAKLQSLINRYRYSLHVLNKEEISESALDSLKKELADLEVRFPEFVVADSPTQRVAGEPLKEFSKFRHSSAMLSLNDGFSEEDIKQWAERIKKLLTSKDIENLQYFAQVKVDGLAAALIYQQGIFLKGGTRGNGLIGEDVTQNLKTIESIPLKIKEKIDYEIRGEVYVKKADFDLINQERKRDNLPLLANPRNAAAGGLRQLDAKISRQRKLSFLAWKIIPMQSKGEEQKKLSSLGFATPPSQLCFGLSDVFSFYKKIIQQREFLPYHIDGVVVSVNRQDLFDKLGVAGKSPRGSIAFKFPLMEAISKIRDIFIQVGRTGILTPVAVLEPVVIGGAKITRATLHNEDEIKRLGVRIGDTVVVGRAGDVIPDILRVLPDLRTGKEKKFFMPVNCPVCGQKTERKAEESAWRCANENCLARKKRYFYFFVGKSGFDIKGIGPKIIDQLTKANLISDPADLFFLRKSDFLSMERFQEKSAQKIISSIERKKTILLPNFIVALGIKGVGEETANDLAALLFSSFKILQPSQVGEVFLKLSQEDLQKIKDIGPVAGENIFQWFREKQNLSFLRKLDKSQIKIVLPKILSKQSLSGKSFVLTGHFSALSREDAKQKIRDLGGKVSENVSQQTNLLVFGQKPGSKMKKALSLGIKTMAEKDFFQQLK